MMFENILLICYRFIYLKKLINKKIILQHETPTFYFVIFAISYLSLVIFKISSFSISLDAFATGLVEVDGKPNPARSVFTVDIIYIYKILASCKKVDRKMSYRSDHAFSFFTQTFSFLPTHTLQQLEPFVLGAYWNSNRRFWHFGCSF
jgi:hypothetical protein